MNLKKRKSVELDEAEYWHFRKFRKSDFLSLIGIVVFGFLFFLNWGFFDWSWMDYHLIKGFVWSDLVYPYFANYLFASGFFVSLMAFFKGGYSKLKSFKEKGLISGLIVGLIMGLIVGLIVGLIYGLVVGWIGEVKEK